MRNFYAEWIQPVTGLVNGSKKHVPEVQDKGNFSNLYSRSYVP